jgi:hypothetical protein
MGKANSGPPPKAKAAAAPAANPAGIPKPSLCEMIRVSHVTCHDLYSIYLIRSRFVVYAYY